MKKQILAKLNKIKALAECTGLTGKMELTFSGIAVSEWDKIVNSITEYPRYKHFIEVAPKVQVTLLLD